MSRGHNSMNASRVPLALMIVTVIVLLFIAALSAGCIEPGYVPHREITVTKLTPDGFFEWSKTIEVGNDVSAHDIIETSDNNFVIAGDHARLIALSNTGDVLWNREYIEPYCGSDLIVGSPDNWTTIFSPGSICRIDSRGNIVWNKSVGIGGFTAIATDDGGFVIAGSDVVKLDREANVTWKTPLGQNTGSAIIEMKNNRGYLIGTHSSPAWLITQLNLTRLDNRGNILNTTMFGLTNNTEISSIQMTSQGYIALYVDNTVSGIDTGRNRFPRWISVHLDQNGSVTASQVVLSSQYNSYFLPPLILTDDGAYFTIKLIPGRNNIAYNHAVKINQDGNTIWDRDISQLSIGVEKKIIQTSDGGYLILGVKEGT
jgi:hypothetical protein